MISRNCTLIRESFDCSTYEKDRMVFVGKLLSMSENKKKLEFAFKVEDHIMRMDVELKKDYCSIVQKYPDSTSKIVLDLKNRGQYVLTLANGYSLRLITETSLVKVDDFGIELKYNLYDETSNKVISLNEIKIIGEGELC